jgi:hypothetical protein
MEDQTTTRLRIVDAMIVAVVAACVLLLALEVGGNVQRELIRLGWRL